jgi:hypothetical protein
VNPLKLKDAVAGEKLETELNKSVKENGFFKYPSLGYDSYYYVAIKPHSIKNEQFADAEAKTSTEIGKSFTHFMNAKRSDRVLVSNFAAEIAVKSGT